MSFLLALRADPSGRTSPCGVFARMSTAAPRGGGGPPHQGLGVRSDQMDPATALERLQTEFYQLLRPVAVVLLTPASKNS
jgi:hypothetical protein